MVGGDHSRRGTCLGVQGPGWESCVRSTVGSSRHHFSGLCSAHFLRKHRLEGQTQRLPSDLKAQNSLFIYYSERPCRVWEDLYQSSRWSCKRHPNNCILQHIITTIMINSGTILQILKSSTPTTTLVWLYYVPLDFNHLVSFPIRGSPMMQLG